MKMTKRKYPFHKEKKKREGLSVPKRKKADREQRKKDPSHKQGPYEPPKILEV